MNTNPAPSAMKIDAVEDELRAQVMGPRVRVDIPTELQAARDWLSSIEEAPVHGVSRTTLSIGPADAVLYTPENSVGSGLVWLHGGGLVAGSPRMDDQFCAETALEIGVTILSVDYRFAPEHPFPAAMDDAFRAWEWLQVNAVGLGLDPTLIAIGGQSAGGGLAASLAQRIFDAGGDLAAQWLWCPMLDDRTAADRTLDPIDHFIWNNESNRFGWASYLGVEPGAINLPPYASSARREDLAGLAPAWIYASDIDLFYNEEVEYAERLRAAGVPVALEIVHGAPHGFEAQGKESALGDKLRGSGREWLRNRFNERRSSMRQ